MEEKRSGGKERERERGREGGREKRKEVDDDEWTEGGAISECRY